MPSRLRCETLSNQGEERRPSTPESPKLFYNFQGHRVNLPNLPRRGIREHLLLARRLPPFPSGATNHLLIVERRLSRYSRARVTIEFLAGVRYRQIANGIIDIEHQRIGELTNIVEPLFGAAFVVGGDPCLPDRRRHHRLSQSRDQDRGRDSKLVANRKLSCAIGP